jgi:hypothetical protein
MQRWTVLLTESSAALFSDEIENTVHSFDGFRKVKNGSGDKGLRVTVRIIRGV